MKREDSTVRVQYEYSTVQYNVPRCQELPDLWVQCRMSKSYVCPMDCGVGPQVRSTHLWFDSSACGRLEPASDRCVWCPTGDVSSDNSRVILKRHGEFHLYPPPLPMLRGGEETTPLVSVSLRPALNPLSLARRMTATTAESDILFLCRSIGATTAVYIERESRRVTRAKLLQPFSQV